MARPRVKVMGGTGIPRLLMSEWCSLWCNICGGVLDTENEGGRRSDLRHLILNEASDYGQLWDDHDAPSPEGDRHHWGEAYYSAVLSEEDTEWLLHFRAFGPIASNGDAHALWSSQAVNASNEPDVFLSEEAKIEEHEAGEIFYVPKPSQRQPSDPHQPGDSGSELEAYWIHKGYIRLYAHYVGTSPFDCAVAHSHCLDLFKRFGKARHLDVEDARTNPQGVNPTTLPQLLSAFALRRAICKPPPGWPSRMVFWQHCFFGAQQAGWDQEAWRNYAGDELYCADPISVSRLTEFASSYDEMPLEKGPIFEGPAERESTPRRLLDLPIEIFEYVCYNLDLRSVCSIRSTCHRAREKLPHLPTFWRSRCITMHGDWFWELSEPTTFPPQTTNWMQILWQIELARTEILDQAGFVPGAHPTEYLRNHKLYEENIYRPMIFDTSGRRKLPLGLKNRLRIWLCLQCIGTDGRQVKLAGQKEGLDDVAHYMTGT